MEMDVNQAYQRWLAYPHHTPDMMEDLRSIAGNEKEIYERFYRDLEFGTGGLRGVLGAGTNRMNVYTVRRASLGFATYLLANAGEGQSASVVIGYDCRRMSKEFALETGLTMAAAGVKAYVFPQLCPTPALSFAVRQLGATGGVMITASHNPPEYNGYKAYGSDGCQLLPDAATQVIERIEAIQDLFNIPLAREDEATEGGMLAWVGPEMDEDYCNTVLSQVRAHSVSDGHRAALRVVYTPLHGTGYVPIRDVLTKAGYANMVIVTEQAQPDGEFPTVKSPNPEEPEALHMAVEEGRKVGADVVIGTDPDADRVGIAVRTPAGRINSSPAIRQVP